MVVHLLHTEQGAGSNPAITTKLLAHGEMVSQRILIPSFLVRSQVGLPNLAVAQWTVQ